MTDTLTCDDCGHHWPNTPTPPPNINPTTGEIRQPVNLPDNFWQTRPELNHIRQAAHNRLVSADATLIATLARAVTLVPPSHVLPAIVGGQVSLNLFTSILDPSGGGKSAAKSVATLLVPIHRKHIVDPILPSSGEGLIEAFMGNEDVIGDDGKKRKERRQIMTAGYAWIDEGQSLLAQSDRSGSIVMETIRSAWMGGDLGQHNATEERKRWLREHRYRLCMTVGFQLTYAAQLIADGEGGTPQRFTFALGTDPTVNPNHDWPGPLNLEQWTSTTSHLTDIDVHPDITTGIRDRRLARSQGRLIVDPLDTHADLRKLKLAAALAILAGRDDINLEDWELATEIDNTSCAVRTMAVERADGLNHQLRETGIRLAIEKEERLDLAKVKRATEAGARSISRRVWRHGPTSLDGAWRLVKSTHRDNADRHDALALAVEREWLTDHGDTLARGRVDPR